MSTFFIEQFGCRATQADAAVIERQLRERGYDSAANANTAGVVVINTCTVTAAADLQARQAIHAIHKQNPKARIVVTGCYAQRAPEEIARLDGVTWVVGNSHKAEIPRIVSGMTNDMTGVMTDDMVAARQLDSSFVPMAALAKANSTGGLLSLDRGPAKILSGNILEQEEFVFAPGMAAEGHTRPVLKIQDGCDSHCSYCVIPQVRGRSRSLAPYRVIEEIRRLVDQGTREVVLSGIDLGSYGLDLPSQDGMSGDVSTHTRRGRLAVLLQRILDETSIERLRLSSIEPMDVTADLLTIFTERDRMAQHFHMPLQSGCDRLLAAMRRKYRAEHYARRAEFVRETLPDAAIGADVIAGFPGETEEDHQATLQLVQQLPVTYLHVFSFSVRPGTAAAEMENQVPTPVIARRARELRALGEKKKREFCATQIGRAMRILTLNRTSEDASGTWTRAISGNYLDVRVSGRWQANRFIDVEITGHDGRLR